MFDNQFVDRAMQGIAGRDDGYDDAYDVPAAWNSIRADLRSRGPFTKMLLELRGSAFQAMQELVYASPGDATRIASLQGEVRRYTHMMTILAEYRSRAATADANNTAESEDETEEDREFVVNLEG